MPVTCIYLVVKYGRLSLSARCVLPLCLNQSYGHGRCIGVLGLAEKTRSLQKEFLFKERDILHAVAWNSFFAEIPNRITTGKTTDLLVCRESSRLFFYQFFVVEVIDLHCFLYVR
ncbi:hypothetical protein IX324_002070 [Bacteroides pyogenes]|nr:hypothetical protein [Bacteroides pyogenes]